MWIALRSMKARQMLHIQVRDQNSCQPVRRSRKKLEPEGEGGGSFTIASSTIAVAQSTACNTITHAGPAEATTMPAMIGPPIVVAERTNDSSALACCRCSGAVS